MRDPNGELNGLSIGDGDSDDSDGSENEDGSRQVFEDYPYTESTEKLKCKPELNWD